MFLHLYSKGCGVQVWSEERKSKGYKEKGGFVEFYVRRSQGEDAKRVMPI